MVGGKALRRFWTDRCDIYVKDGAADGQTGRTVFSEQKLHGDIPCKLSYRLSFETVGAVRDVGDVTAAGQAVKLFLAPDILIPPGSRVVVKRGGQEMAFWRSGAPAVFDRHQEVRVERQERWT